MARQRKAKKAETASYLPKVHTVTEEDVTVNIHNENQTSRRVAILFKSRGNQSFQLPNGREVTIVGNGVYLAGVHGGALPAGGYGVTILDKDDWEAIKAAFPGWIKKWLDGGIIVEKATETAAINYAQDNADAPTDADPIDPSEMRTTAAPNPNDDEI